MRKDTTINTETKELMDLNITEILLPEKNGFFSNKRINVVFLRMSIECSLCIRQGTDCVFFVLVDNIFLPQSL